MFYTSYGKLSHKAGSDELKETRKTDVGKHRTSCFLEAGIFASHLVWRFRTRKIRKAAAAEGKTFDDVLAEHEARGERFKWADRKWRGGKASRKRGEAAVDEEEAEAGYTAEEEEEEDDRGYTTEDKLCNKHGEKPDSPVAIGFPPGTAVERTIDGRMLGEE